MYADRLALCCLHALRLHLAQRGKYTRYRTTVIEQHSHHGLVVVDEGTTYTILVYCDPFYEKGLYNY